MCRADQVGLPVSGFIQILASIRTRPHACTMLTCKPESAMTLRFSSANNALLLKRLPHCLCQKYCLPSLCLFTAPGMFFSDACGTQNQRQLSGMGQVFGVCNVPESGRFLYNTTNVIPSSLILFPVRQLQPSLRHKVVRSQSNCMESDYTGACIRQL